MFKAPLAAVRSVLAARDFGAYLNWYVLRGGYAFAHDGKMAAGAPCEHGLDRLVPGTELDDLVARLPDEITLMSDDKSITLKAGRMRGTIQTLPSDSVSVPSPEGEWQKPPPTFVEALRLARPFIAEVAAQAYGTCACLRAGSVIATTNIALVEVTCPDLDPGATDLCLPSWAVDFILKAKDDLDGIMLLPDYAAFRWSSGLWMRTQLVAGAFPAAITTLLASVEPTQPLAISADWRGAYDLVAGCSEGLITAEPTRILGGRGHSKVEHDVDPIALGEPIHFNPKFLTAVVHIATHWNPAVYPKPIPFVGPDVRGLIVGRRA